MFNAIEEEAFLEGMGAMGRRRRRHPAYNPAAKQEWKEHQKQERLCRRIHMQAVQHMRKMARAKMELERLMGQTGACENVKRDIMASLGIKG